MLKVFFLIGATHSLNDNQQSSDTIKARFNPLAQFYSLLNNILHQVFPINIISFMVVELQKGSAVTKCYLRYYSICIEGLSTCLIH